MRTKDILYLKEEDFVSIIVEENSSNEIYSIRSEINKLAKRHLFNILDYRKLVRRELQLKNKIPIYFSNNLLLFNIKTKNTCYWINYFNILKICYENSIVVIFKNGETLLLDISKRNLLNEIKKIEKVLNYISNL